MPKISVIIPHRVDRSRIMTVDTLYQQTLKDFEVIIINDVDKDGASACRNVGASKATGNYLLFLDDDLILKEDMLKKMSDILDIIPTISLVYCDYDISGYKHGKQFGELWDIDLLKKRNYISTMSMIRKNVFHILGGFNASLERFQDWDLWLRFSQLPGAKAWYINESLFTAYFDGIGISDRSKLDFYVQCQKIKKLHDIKEYDSSVIIPIHNELELSKNCLKTVLENTLSCFEVIIVDDGSNQETKEWLRTVEDIGVKIVTMPHQSGHTKAINAGVEKANGDFLFLLNNDTLVPKAWDTRLMNILINNMQICAVGPLTSSASSIQMLKEMYEHRLKFNAKDINSLDRMVTSKRERAVIPAKITGFCMATTKFIWECVGPFDEKIEAGGNEADWIIRAMKIGLTPAVYTGLYVHHYGNVSYSKYGNVKDMWNQGNNCVKIKHGEDAYNKLEQDMWKKLIK